MWRTLIIAVLHGYVCGYNLDAKFPITFRSEPDNYFGYNVALHLNRDGPRALVAAPRANSTVLMDQVFQPGVLYNCAVQDPPSACSEVVLDTKGNTQTIAAGNELSHYDRKDDMWLGVSLDIQQGQPQNDIVTCGHLWKNQYYRSHYLTNGVCYVINGDLDPSSVKKLLPLINRSKQAIIPPGVYYFAFAQAGMSAAYSADGKDLVIGAPGFYDWMGTILSYPTDYTNAPRYTKAAIPDPPKDTTPEAYLGYSVTSGKFFDHDDMFYAVGAPRDGTYHGRVYIFKASNVKKKELIIHLRKEGTQFGEYFGANVLGVNLNGDAFTDLLISAPFYSLDGGDEGKVYVYISNGIGLQDFVGLHGDKKPFSRFGSALANVGDLNQDGFNDIAVGAPYEDGKGAVYIYHGSDLGLNEKYVQKISASEVNSGLSGFGISISRGLDIDGNRYPDVLVGSYLSSEAVLFRTRPVIQLLARFIIAPSQINTNATSCVFQGTKHPCVGVTACLWYAGKHGQLSLDFEHEVLIEPPSLTNSANPRGFFQRDDKGRYRDNRKTTLEIGTEQCFTNMMYIRVDIKDIITPIQVMYRYRIAQPEEYDKKFLKNFPVIDPASPSFIATAITFQTGCGKEDTCFSDLRVTAELLGKARRGTMILGEESSLSLAITVRNNGEPAYSSELYIHLPQDMPSINQDICSSTGNSQNNTLVCPLGNPLLPKGEVKILIKLDISKIPTYTKAIDIVLEAVTASNDTYMDDNTVRIPIDVKAISDISISGLSSQEQVLYDEEDPQHQQLFISHTYTVRNHGPSPIQMIDILLLMPTAFKGANGELPFLTFTSLETDSGKQLTIPAKCNDTYLDIKSVLPDVKVGRDKVFDEKELIARKDNDTPTIQPSYLLDTDSSFTDDSKQINILNENRFTNETQGLRTKKSVDNSKMIASVTINCQNEKVDCIAIQCSASPFIDTRKVAQITVAAQLNASVLNDFLGPWYRLEFITVGQVTLRDDSVQQLNNIPDIAHVKTVFVHKGPPPQEELAWWIIIVSIAAGILLLIVILILLVKFGFFKREQKEKMDEMKEAENKEYEPLENESSENDKLQ